MMWHAGEPKDGVLWVEINWADRPVNALSRATLAELSQLLSSVQANSAIRGVVFKSGKSGNFIAGADVTEFQKLQSPDEAPISSNWGSRSLTTSPRFRSRRWR